MAAIVGRLNAGVNGSETSWDEIIGVSIELYGADKCCSAQVQPHVCTDSLSSGLELKQ